MLWVSYGAWIGWAAKRDLILSVEAPGVGLLQHYGFVASYLLGPVIVWLTWQACVQFRALRRIVVNSQPTKTDRATVRAIAEPHMRSLRLDRRSTFVLALLILLTAIAERAVFRGFAGTTYMGREVFNAPAFDMSYRAANSWLVVLWTVVYPLAAFYVSHIGISSCIIIRRLSSAGLLRLDYLKGDGCGGLKPLRVLSFTQLAAQMAVTLTILLFVLTFGRTYFSLLAVIAIFLLCIGLNGVALWLITGAFEKERERQLADWNGVIRRSMERDGVGSTKTLVAMDCRDRVLRLRLFSWASHVAPLINIVVLISAIARSWPAGSETSSTRFRDAAVATQSLTAADAITLDYRWRGRRASMFPCPSEGCSRPT